MTDRAGKLYQENPFVASIKATVGLRQGVGDLEAILERHKTSLPVGFREQPLTLLSIDIDGLDYWVWKEAESPMLRAAIVCIEYNPTIPLHVRFVNAKDECKRQGTSVLSLCELAEEKGYVLAETTLYNAIFVRRDLWASVQQHLPSDLHGDLHELCDIRYVRFSLSWFTRI